MKRYQCHKIVEAVKVTRWTIFADGSLTLYGDDDPDEGFQFMPGRFTPDDPGYVVRYADGYVSWSPTAAFEDGYTEITE